MKNRRRFGALALAGVLVGAGAVVGGDPAGADHSDYYVDILDGDGILSPAEQTGGVFVMWHRRAGSIVSHGFAKFTAWSDADQAPPHSSCGPFLVLPDSEFPQEDGFLSPQCIQRFPAGATIYFHMQWFLGPLFEGTDRDSTVRQIP